MCMLCAAQPIRSGYVLVCESQHTDEHQNQITNDLVGNCILYALGSVALLGRATCCLMNLRIRKGITKQITDKTGTDQKAPKTKQCKKNKTRSCRLARHLFSEP